MMMKIAFSKKYFLPIIGTVGLFVVGFSLIGLLGLCEKAAASSCPTQHHKITTPEGNVELAKNYFQYSPETLAAAKQKGTVVLYFWAPWCASCTSLDLDLQDGKAEIPNGITVLRVNYDQERELKQKYAVTTQHTFVQINQNDEVLATWVGGDIVDFSRHLR